MSTNGNDTLSGTDNADVIDGLEGNDNIDGRGGNDTLQGSAGDDWLLGSSGNDQMDGGSGYDFVAYSVTSDTSKPLSGVGVTVNLITGIATDNWGDQDTFLNIEGVHGSRFDDTLMGGNPANGQLATDGWELFRGNGGNDMIDGGSGWDVADYANSTAAVTVVLGGTAQGTAEDGFGGTDTLVSIEDVRGSAHNDTLSGSDTGSYENFRGNAGNDVIDGKGGYDRVDYSAAPSAVVVNLAAGTAQDGQGGTDTLRNIEDVRGSNYDDDFAGDAGNNAFDGGLGNDRIDGGDGTDTLRYDRASGGVTVNLEAGVASGSQGEDTFFNIENVQGSNYDDVLTGNAQANQFRGNGGNDQVDGGAGRDAMVYAALARADCVITVSGSGWTVSSSAEGADTLVNIERVAFTDQKLAFDLSGSAGDTALLMGALLGAASLQDKALVGSLLGLADGGLNLAALADLAVGSGVVATLAGGSSNADVARLLMRNVLGSDADSALVNALSGLVDSGAFTQAGLIAAAAGLDVNKLQIDLVGLGQAGLAFV